MSESVKVVSIHLIYGLGWVNNMENMGGAGEPI